MRPLSIVFVCSCVLAAVPTAFAQHSTREVVDWPGTYAGVLPSGSGSGYHTYLVLQPRGNRYTLVQSIEHKGKMEHFRSSGRFTWDRAGSVITLARKDGQRFFIGEGQAWQVGDDGKPPTNPSYELRKLRSVPGGRGEELLFDPATVKADTPRKGWVSFDGTWNIDRPTQMGHRSFQARFELDCAGTRYRMPTMRYHARTYLQGTLIHEAKDNDGDIPITREDRVMRRVTSEVCPNR